MRIGITEGGDPALDFSWEKRIGNMDFSILITKELSDELIRRSKPYWERIIFHLGCTGFGQTVLEPFVPSVDWQLHQLRRLLSAGFPKEQVVVRIDPIIPTEKGLLRAQSVVDGAAGLTDRFRISVLDMYPHVRRRFAKAGLPLPYGNGFSASAAQFALVDDWLSRNQSRGRFACCAEPKLQNCEPTGCVSEEDARLFGLVLDAAYPSGFQRQACRCPGCKRELLAKKGRCAHGCLYCFWKDDSDWQKNSQASV